MCYRYHIGEHSVLVTGYDENYIYFNDSMTVEVKNKHKRFSQCMDTDGKTNNYNDKKSVGHEI